MTERQKIIQDLPFPIEDDENREKEFMEWHRCKNLLADTAKFKRGEHALYKGTEYLVLSQILNEEALGGKWIGYMIVAPDFSLKPLDNIPEEYLSKIG